MRVQLEAHTKAAHVLAKKIPDHMIGLFVEPVLLEGEDPNLYWNMVSVMIDEHRPKILLDWIAVNDLVTKLWEERVFRRATNAIIRGGQRLAVHQFMSEILPGDHRVERLKKIDDTADHRANRYFSTSKKESEEIRSHLAKYGITQAELLARSAQNNIDAILMFEEMVSSRERRRRKLQNEIRRRRPSQGVKSGAYEDADVHRQGQYRPCQELKADANEEFDAHHHGRPSQESKAASSGELGVHQMSEPWSCQEVKPDAKQDTGLHHLDPPGSCQEVKAKVGEVGAQHRGH